MRGTAGQFWADTAESYLGGMASQYEPEESTATNEQRTTRRVLPPLTPSEDIIAAIAACAPRQRDCKPVAVPSRQGKLAEVG